MTLVVVEAEEGVGLGCTEDLPKVELVVTTVALGACVRLRP